MGIARPSRLSRPWWIAQRGTTFTPLEHARWPPPWGGVRAWQVTRRLGGAAWCAGWGAVPRVRERQRARLGLGTARAHCPERGLLPVTTPLTTRHLFADFIAEMTAAAQLLLKHGYEESEIDALEELCRLVCADLRVKHGVSPRFPAQDRAGTRRLAPFPDTTLHADQLVVSAKRGG